MQTQTIYSGEAACNNKKKQKTQEKHMQIFYTEAQELQNISTLSILTSPWGGLIKAKPQWKTVWVASTSFLESENRTDW